MRELYLGIDIEKDRLHAALTENAETVVTVTEPLDGSSFGRFCERAVSMISELAQEYRPKSIGLTGDPKGIVYIDSNGNAVSELMLSPKKEDDYIVKYNYYSVWIMEKDLYEIQLKEFFSEK